MQDKITIRFPRSSDGFRKFVSAVGNAFVEGYVVPAAYNTEGRPLFGSHVGINLVKADDVKAAIQPEIEIPESDEAKVERLYGLALSGEKAAKEDWLWLASKKGIVIPEEMNNPLQIRKTIKEALTSELKTEA